MKRNTKPTFSPSNLPLQLFERPSSCLFATNRDSFILNITSHTMSTNMQFNTFGKHMISMLSGDWSRSVLRRSNDSTHRSENAIALEFLVFCLPFFSHSEILFIPILVAFQTPSRTPETTPAEAPRKRSTFVSSSATDENVSRPSPVWPTIWTLSEFARPSRRISLVTVPSKRTRTWGRLFSCRVTSEQTSRPFWWTKKSVTANLSFCTVSKQTTNIYYGFVILFV